ncbi:predicted protein [Uncinocarpus reesii 1704]|uniref:Translation initiation factor 3 N-terminal domain-containing protein n=1 Tax=Uncinocarpus reesii (strain UAMH 1704) TaxID=336963 RepID=C4JQM6_UNCRE|nr:uncharacterized protein UREG_03371 [Uncinocarpus reesii 1704]EEP78525.1 predicted protein [Uncinocarpus reesii 1704]
MSHTRPVFSAAQALRSAFLPPVQVHARRPAIGSLNIYRPKGRNISYRPRFDHFNTEPPENAPRLSVATTPSPNAPADSAIRYPIIQTMNEDGTLNPPTPLRQALRNVNQLDESLILLQHPTDDYPAICKVFSKKTLRQQQYARTRTAKLKLAKQVELNWAIDPHDLSKRLDQVESFLAKGKKTELVLTPKRRARRATPAEGEKVLAIISEWIEKVGVIQNKPKQGEFLGYMQYFFEGKK